MSNFRDSPPRKNGREAVDNRCALHLWSTQVSNKRNVATANDFSYKNSRHMRDRARPQRFAMTPSSLVIVTDRGSLKAYRVNQTPTRGPSLQLVQAFNLTDAHGRLIDKVSDLAGRFPVTEGAGAHRGPASTAERTHLATETNRRIQRELADQIAKIVSQNGKDGWSFAAPAEIHTAIVELLPADVRQRIVEHVKSDLVKVEPARLMSHFRSLRQI